MKSRTLLPSGTSQCRTIASLANQTDIPPIAAVIRSHWMTRHAVAGEAALDTSRPKEDAQITGFRNTLNKSARQQ
jgi:hypothetical protein